MKKLYQLDTGWGCGGIWVEDNVITGGAPIFRKLYGKNINHLPRNYKINKIKQMKSYYAGIGSRNLTPDELQVCFNIGAELAKKGHILKTGAAKGADQAFAEGAISEEGRVHLYLPWYSYEKDWWQNKPVTKIILGNEDHTAWESVRKLHPAPDKLSQAATKLHARNYLIIENCELVIAFPGQKLGGTGQGLRVADYLGIKILNLRDR